MGVVVVTSGEVSGGDWTGPGLVGVCGGVVLVTGVDGCGATGAESPDGEETSKN